MDVTAITSNQSKIKRAWLMPCNKEDKMVYSDKLVVVLKHKGKILREHKDVVTLPFGSEYSVLIKNLNSVKAKISIAIDGEDVLDGQALLVDANTTTELKGFLKGNKATNRFRFIEKTEKISNYRGDRIDDGIIRVEYQFEKQWNWDWNMWSTPVVYNDPAGPTCNSYYVGSNPIQSKGPVFGANLNNLNCCTHNMRTNEDGITVKGSEVHQGFKYGDVGILEDTKHTIVLKLRGTNKMHNKVEKPILVKQRLLCNTCGVKSKSFNKYCPNCGTYLH